MNENLPSLYDFVEDSSKLPSINESVDKDLPSLNDLVEDSSKLPSINESVDENLPSYKDFLEIEEKEEELLTEEIAPQQSAVYEQTIINEVHDNSAIISLIEGVRNSIPEVKSYDKELFELVTLIEEVRKEIPVIPEPPEIPEIPEVKYYDDEISQLQESIEEVKSREIYEFVGISEALTSINEDYESVSSSLAQIKGKLELEVNNLLETLEVNKFEASTDSKSIRSTLDSKIETNDQTIREDVKRIKDKIYDNLRETSLKIWNLNREYRKEDKELKKQISEQYKTLRDAIIAAVDSSDQKLDENYSKINKYFDGLREEVRSLPEVKYYDDQIDKVNESVKSVKNLVEVLENKLNKKIAGLKESILVVPPTENNTDPLTPLNQNFATLDDLANHYRLFLNRIQQQLASLGGGGETRLEFLDDVDRETAKVDGKFLKYQASTGKWIGADIGGVGTGGTWTVDTVGISTTKNVGIGTTAKTGYSLYVQGDARITGILTVGESSVTIDGKEDKIIIGSGTTITEGGNAEFVGVITASGIHLDDGNAINMGDNDDLQIYHVSNGTGIIQNAGSGQLQLRSNTIRLLNQATDEDFAFFRDDGAVELYYDNVKRFETTGYGVTVSGISSATNVSIANTFRYPPYIIGGQVPRAIKSQGGYARSSAFDDFQTATEASQDPADYIEYTQELANTGTWKRFGITTAGNTARDGNWWGETNPNYDQSRGLFGGLTNPAGVDNLFDFSDNTVFNNAQTTGSLKYTQALGSFSLKECNVGDLVLARFDLNIMPMVTNTTVEVALIYANRDASDNITFTFPLTITPYNYGSGTVGRGYLLRPTITAYMANDQDVNSRSLLAIKADNPILVNPIGVLFTIQR